MLRFSHQHDASIESQQSQHQTSSNVWLQPQREATTTNSGRKITADLLEGAFICRLYPKGDDEERVYFPLRWDAHFLSCRTRSVGSIFGIAEELHLPDDLRHTSLTITEYQRGAETKVDTSQALNFGNPRSEALHSEWRRSPLSHHPVKSKTINGEQSLSRSIAWIDLRKDPTSLGVLLNSKAAFFRSIRSLFTCTHDVSPWQNSSEYNDTPSHHDHVVFVLPEPSSLARDFRVGDAAPSWHLQSYVLCKNLEDWDFWKLHPSLDAPSGHVYIYKRLPQRLKMSNQHPESSIPAPEGCLWETIEIKDGGGDGEEEGEYEDDIANETQAYATEHRLVCPPYANLEELYSSKVLKALFDPKHVEIFRQEALRIPLWTPWPETQHYSVSSSAHASNPNKPWTVFPLCYCFPANQPEKIKWVESTEGFCPQTCQILKSIETEELGLVVRTALFSQLAPETTLEPHTGWADLANHVLRLHVPLIVPQGGLCGTWVDGCVETHQEGTPLLFDDSKIHRAFNYHPTETRIVLIVDVARPKALPLGYATGGHSEELDSFIQQMSAPR
ncbi:MAG: hypothetical protein SGBAC_009335 [Bacillariaceae sp.]